MKVFSTDHTFDYSWSEVSTANWLKYSPWNKSTNHVVAVDTLSRRVDSDTGILRTERLITCTQSVPQWVLTLLGTTTSHVLETSYVDPKAQRVVMCSTNLSYRSVMSVTETVTYEPDTSIVPLSSTIANTAAVAATNHERIASGAKASTSSLLSSSSSSSSSSENSAILSQLHLIPSSITPQPRTRFTQEARITALCGGWKKIREKVEEATIERFAENAKRGREGFEAVLETSRRVFGEEREKERLAAQGGWGGGGGDSGQQ